MSQPRRRAAGVVLLNVGQQQGATGQREALSPDLLVVHYLSSEPHNSRRMGSTAARYFRRVSHLHEGRSGHRQAEREREIYTVARDIIQHCIL